MSAPSLESRFKRSGGGAWEGTGGRRIGSAMRCVSCLFSFPHRGPGPSTTPPHGEQRSRGKLRPAEFPPCQSPLLENRRRYWAVIDVSWVVAIPLDASLAQPLDRSLKSPSSISPSSDRQCFQSVFSWPISFLLAVKTERKCWRRQIRWRGSDYKPSCCC